MVTITPLSNHEQLADRLMAPIMKGLMLLARCPNEHPQQTHFWNNQKGEFPFNRGWAVYNKGNPDAPAAGGLKRHLPPPFGWQDYIVLHRGDRDPRKPFFIGWVGDDVSGISRIRCYGATRVLEGPKPVYFPGFDPDGTQVPLEQIGQGKLGDGKWHDVPLL